MLGSESPKHVLLLDATGRSGLCHAPVTTLSSLSYSSCDVRTRLEGSSWLLGFRALLATNGWVPPWVGCLKGVLNIFRWASDFHSEGLTRLTPVWERELDGVTPRCLSLYYLASNSTCRYRNL